MPNFIGSYRSDPLGGCRGRPCEVANFGPFCRNYVSKMLLSAVLVSQNGRASCGLAMLKATGSSRTKISRPQNSVMGGLASFNLLNWW